MKKQFLHVHQEYKGQVVIMDDSLQADIYDQSMRPAYNRILEVTDSPEPRFAHSVYEITPEGYLNFLGEDWDGQG